MRDIFKTVAFYCRQFNLRHCGHNISKGIVFCLHRVSKYDPSRLMANENMKVSPDFLDLFLSKYEDKVDFIRLEDVGARITENNKKPFMAFSLDDGYKDNFTQALPIFKKHNCPFTIFLTSNFPDGKAVLWWYEIENLLLVNDYINLGNGKTYETRTFQQKEKAFMDIREDILKIDQFNLIDGLNRLFAGYQIDWTAMCKQMCLSWEDIKTLNNEELATIGAHTKHHYNLRALASEEDVAIEILDGWNRIKEMTEIESSVFAYPFGAETEATEREFKVLNSMSSRFKLAVKAVGGAVTNEQNDMYSIPRQMLYNGFKMTDISGYNQYILNLL